MVERSHRLHFTRVLDVYQELEVEEEGDGEQVGRPYWERRASSGALAALDRIVSLVQTTISLPRVTYNRNHIALGTTGVNFCWFILRRKPGMPPPSPCNAPRRVRKSSRSSLTLGLYVRPFRAEAITFKLRSPTSTDISP
jgi:hypothetical protein